MRKMFLALATLVCSMSMNAQLMRIYHGDTLVARYTVDQADKVVYEKAHEYVDLGLPSGLKWATCNVGATVPEEYGEYFAWAETYQKRQYWTDYTYCNGSEETLTKYCFDSNYGTVDNKTSLDITDDAAYMNWGDKWRMPTDVEMTELITNCTWNWETLNGINGYRVTGTNGNSIFLPAGGARDTDDTYAEGNFGRYWSSVLDDVRPYHARTLDFKSYKHERSYYRRDAGISVRAVLVE